jgi:hypothetical protein
MFVKGTLLLPHAAKVRLRNTSILNVETKKDVGFLMSVFPADKSNCLYDLLPIRYPGW